MNDSKILRFPKRRVPPQTLSQLVEAYRARRVPRGPYRTPLPNDYRPEVSDD